MSKKHKTKAVAVTEQPRTAPTVDSWVDVLVPVGELARSIADTDFVPDSFRKNVGSVAASILYGREVGLPPMAALTSVHVIKGKPSLSAESMRGLVLAAGHDIQFTESNSTRCVIAGRRAGQERWTEAQFNMDDAKRAGLTGGNWSKYPADMLIARATSRLCRMLFPDVIGGLHTLEEMSDATPDEPPKRVRATTKRAARARKPKAPVTSTAATEPEPDQAGLPALPALPDATPPTPDKVVAIGDMVTAKQLQKLSIQVEELKVTERAHKLQLVEAIVGRALQSSKELTKAEATTVIDHLATVAAAKDPEEALAFTFAMGDPQ